MRFGCALMSFSWSISIHSPHAVQVAIRSSTSCLQPRALMMSWSLVAGMNALEQIDS